MRGSSKDFQVGIDDDRDTNRTLIILGISQGNTQSYEGLCDTGQNAQTVIFNDSDSYSADRQLNGQGTQLNNIDSLVSLIQEKRVKEVFILPESIARSSLVRLAQRLAGNGVRLKVDLDQYEELVGTKISSQEILLPGLQLLSKHNGPCYRVFKRILDIAISLVGLLFLILLYPIVAIAIKVTSPGSVFYRQERVGLHGEIFTMWKFRTMYADAEKNTGPIWANANDDRITPIGKFLRKTRLDETAQFFHVLSGKMSIIGPRPERPSIVRELKDQIPYYTRRLQLKPGITGWAQVNLNYDRELNDVRRKLHYDLYYIQNNSVSLDFAILLRTIQTVVTGRGAH